jgi:hypothetical protein
MVSDTDDEFAIDPWMNARNCDTTELGNLQALPGRMVMLESLPPTISVSDETVSTIPSEGEMPKSICIHFGSVVPLTDTCQSGVQPPWLELISPVPRGVTDFGMDHQIPVTAVFMQPLY